MKNKDENNRCLTPQKEEEIIAKIKSTSEKLEIPKTLQPDIMMEKLRKSEKKENIKNRRVIYMGGLAAAVCIVIIFVIAWNKVNVVSKKSADDTLDNNSEFVVQSEQGFTKLESYSGLENYLKNHIVEDQQNFEEIYDAVGEENSIEDKGLTSQDEMDYLNTNTRTSDVDEGDFVKTNGKYIFTVSSETPPTIKIYEAAGKDTTQIGLCQVNIEKQKQNSNILGITSDSVKDMYVYDNKLIVLLSYIADNWTEDELYVLIYDVTNPQNCVKISENKICGTYESSRLAGGYLYIFTRKNICIENGDIEPKINDESIDCADIYVEGNEYYGYEVVTSIQVDDKSEVKDTIAMLTANKCMQYYVSDSNIYFYNTIYKANQSETEIIKFGYQDGKIEAKNIGTIEGSISGAFAIDEYNGYLRVVADVEKYEYTRNRIWNDTLDDRNLPQIEENELSNIVNLGKTNALYILDENLNMTGEIKDIANGESIYGVRFMGDIGYFVTYLNTDPLFSVDLSNASNPQIIGKLKIPGFSSYLHPWGADALLGIGEEENEIKISLYDISNPASVEESDKMILDNFNYSNALYDYKAVLVTKEKNLIGFSAEKMNITQNVFYETETDYILTSEEDKKIQIKAIFNISDVFENNIYLGDIRSLYVDDNLYLVTRDSGIAVYSLNDYSLLTRTIELN